MRLRPLGEELWVAETPLKLFGVVELGARMTVVRLQDGGLFLHSPLRITDDLRRELDALGPVRYAVGPNLFHHLYLRSVRQAYPEAEILGAPGLERKRLDLHFDGVLGEEPEKGWADDLQQVPFAGAPLMSEVVFHHPRSRTLILTDLAFNVRRSESLPTRLALGLTGVYGRFGQSVLERLAIRDRKAARASVERILEWDFERVVMSHGEVLEEGGKQAVRDLFAWL